MIFPFSFFKKSQQRQSSTIKYILMLNSHWQWSLKDDSIDHSPHIPTISAQIYCSPHFWKTPLMNPGRINEKRQDEQEDPFFGKGINPRIEFQSEEDSIAMNTPPFNSDTFPKKIQQVLPVELKLRNRHRGLRRIAQKLLIMIQQQKAVPQVKVATRLLSKYLNQQEFKGKIEQEQNIRRRICDALSSLIYIGVLKKQKKMIVIGQKSKERKASSCQLQEISSLNKEIAIKSKKLSSRYKMLSDVKSKLAIFKALLQRNQIINQTHQEIIPFPFVGVGVIDNLDQYVSIFVTQKIEQPLNQELLISASQPFQLFGDIDSIKWLQMKKTQNPFIDISLSF